MNITCALGCFSPAIGMANLAGLPATKVQGESGTYALCEYHYRALQTTWTNVRLEGMEFFPNYLEVQRETGTKTDSDLPWTEEG